MASWLASAVSGMGWGRALAAAAVFLVTFFGSLAVVGVLLVKMPADFFVSDRRGPRRGPTTAVGWLRRILKNLLGVGLVLLGFMLAVPGIPGQGLLTILIGVVLLDFPGKRSLERKLIGRRRVLRTVNRLRARFGKPPVVLEKSSRQ